MAQRKTATECVLGMNGEDATEATSIFMVVDYGCPLVGAQGSF